MQRDVQRWVETIEREDPEKPAALAQLMGRLSSRSPRKRAEAAAALEAVRAVEAIEELTRLLHDKDARVRSASLAALGTIRGQSAAEELAFMLEDPSLTVRRQAAATLSSLDWKGHTPRQRVLYYLAAEDYIHLGMERFEAFDTLCDMLRARDALTRWQAAISLGVLRRREALPALRARLTLFGEQNTSVRKEIVQAIRLIEEPTEPLASRPRTAGEDAAAPQSRPREATELPSPDGMPRSDNGEYCSPVRKLPVKISDVEVHLLSCVMPEPILLTYYGGQRTIYKRDAMLICVRTDGGLTGYAPGPASLEAADLMRGPIRSALLGAEAGDARRLRLLVPDADVDGSAVAQAYGAVEIALYDLWGKMEGAPVSELLGGRVRHTIQLYGSAGMYQSPEGYAAEAAAVQALGFAAFKMRPALGPEGDLETVRQMRAATGPGFGLMVDAHTWWRMGDRSYTPAQILAQARAMAEYDITWLEEPLPPTDRDAYRDLWAQQIVTVAAGEHETALAGLQELVETGMVDVAQADVAHSGGYPVCHAALRAVQATGRSFAFHSWGTLLEVLACAHLGICHGEKVAPWLEYPCYAHRGQPIMYPYPLADEILAEPLDIRQGTLHVPQGPGLGIDIDERVIERYPYRPGPWTLFQLTSPPEQWVLSADHAAAWTTHENVSVP